MGHCHLCVCSRGDLLFIMALSGRALKTQLTGNVHHQGQRGGTNIQFDFDAHLNLEGGDRKTFFPQSTTPGTRVSPGFRNWTLAVKSRKKCPKISFCKLKMIQKFIYILYIPSVKILRPIKNQLPRYPQSGWKAMSVEKEKKKREEERKSVLTMVSTNAWTKTLFFVKHQ